MRISCWSSDVCSSDLYRGASAEVIESQVTRVLEESLAGIEGIDYIRSITRPERSLVVVRFELSRDPEATANDVRDRVSRVRGKLPESGRASCRERGWQCG